MALLNDISRDMPALEQALKISERAVANGFEWQNEEGVWAKVYEEIAEFKEATNEADKELEFGDILFSLVNVARWNGINPEEALLATCDKFRSRWSSMENQATQANVALDSLSAEELMSFWKSAKREEKHEQGRKGSPAQRK